MSAGGADGVGLWAAVALWGPGLLILVGLYLLIRRMVPLNFFGRFLEAQERQAQAFQDLSAAVREQGSGQERRLAELAHGQDVILERLNSIRDALRRDGDVG